MRIFSLFIVFISQCFILQGRDVTLAMYTVNDGLSQSSVYRFCQDKTGFLWVGTGDGLNRFDGYEFKVFKRHPQNIRSLSENTIRGIVEDVRGRLWIGTEKGMNLYDPIAGNISRWHATDSVFGSGCCVPFAQSGPYLYFSVRLKGIYKVDVRNDTWVRIAPPELSIRDEGYCREGDIVWYVTYYNRLARMDLRTGRTKTVAFNGNEELIGVRLLKPGRLIVNTRQRLVFLDKISGRELPVKYPDELKGHIIRALLPDSRGNIWVAVIGEGIYLYTADWRLIKKYTQADNAYYTSSILLDNVVSFFEDRSANIWFGTDGAGMGCIRYNQLKFKEYNGIDGYTYPLSASFVKSFYTDNEDNVYVGTYKGGLNVINRRTHQAKLLLPLPEDRSDYSANTISCILGDEESNTLYLGTDKGLYLLNTKTRQMLAANLPGGGTIRILSIFRNSKGDIVACSPNGIYTLRIAEGKYTLELTGNVPFVISAVYPQKNGGYVVCPAYRGLYYWDGASKIAPVKTIEDYQKVNGQVLFKCLLWDGHGNIWAATNSGLFRMDEQYHIQKVYGLEDGLPDLFIYGILGDKQGNLWMSTNKGLCSFDVRKEKFISYKIEDGLQSYEFNSGAFYKDPTGRLYFGGVNGFNAFYPEEIQLNTQAPAVALVKVSLFDEPLSLDSILSKGRTLVMPWYKNTLSFELAGLEYTLPGNNQYAFHLDGLEEGWFHAGSRRFIRYSALKPGKYTLWAQAANADGIWSPPQKLLSMSIQPPFWQSWWFIALVFSTLAAGLTLAAYLFTSARYRKKLALMERQREIMEIRSRISRDIHDDIGAGLTRISILSQRLRTGRYQNADISQSLEKLALQSQEIVHNLGEIVWTVNPQHDQLNSMLAYLRNFAADFLENADIAYHFQFPEEAPESPLHPDLRRNIFLVVKECLNNIVKHSAASEVCIEFLLRNENFEIRIHDNGRGISGNNGFGNGLKNMRQRMELIGASFQIDSVQGHGTTVRIQGLLF